MVLSYDQMYLADVQKNLGFLFQFCLCNLRKTPEELQRDFLSSEIPYQIEIGNPDFLSGKSGFELAFLIYQDIEKEIRSALQEQYCPQADYWTGFILAYSQWKLQCPFRVLLERYSLERILASYPLMHEADVSKMVEVFGGCNEWTEEVVRG